MSLPSRIAFLSIVTLSFAGCGTHPHPASDAAHDHAGHDHQSSPESHPPSVQLLVSSVPAKPTAQETTRLRLMLHDANGQMLKDFEPVHEKLAHFIVVREGLNQFAHLHPNVKSDGMMAVDYAFPLGGIYHCFLDYKTKGKPQSTATATFEVGGDNPAPPPLTPNVPGKIKGDGLDAEATLAPLANGLSQTMTFLVTDSSGSAVTDLQPYLGALGHLVVLSAKGDEYVHAHPKEVSGADSKVPFEIHFPHSGTFKAWGQFQRGGKVFTIPAVVEVNAAQGHH